MGRATMAAIRRRLPPPRCEFCGAELADRMIAFMDHLEDSAPCRMLWEEQRENIKRESGGT